MIAKCHWSRLYCIACDIEYEQAVAVNAEPTKKCKCGKSLLVVAHSTGETSRPLPTPLMNRRAWAAAIGKRVKPRKSTKLRGR